MWTRKRSSSGDRDGACCLAKCKGASSAGRRSRDSMWTSIRTCCATRSPRTCCNRRATCARCRKCWATRASPRRRSTRTSTSSTSPRSTTPPTRARAARRRRARPMAASVITPVTVLTGFLGSGKTTLLKRILADPRYADTAVIVNEFGEVAIDHLLVREASENVVVLAGGCICCRVAGDLVRTLRELHHQRSAGSIPAFRRAVIETTGLADPAPLLASMIELPMIAARYSLSGVAATVDAEHRMRTLDEHEEAVKQVALADRLVITKDDLASAARVAELEERLRALNPGARVLRSGLAPIDPAQVLDAGLYRPETRSVDARGWLEAGAH